MPDKLPRLLATLSVLALCGSAAAWAGPPAGYPFVRYDEAVRASQQTGKPLFIYFGREGCGFCGKTNAESFSQPPVRDLYTRNWVLAYVDTESGERLRLASGERLTESELAVRMQAWGTPLFVYADPAGKVLLRAHGFQSAGDLEANDRKARTGDAR